MLGTTANVSTDTNGLELYIKYGFYFEPITAEAYEKLSKKNKVSYDSKLRRLNRYLEKKKIKEEALIARKLISQEKKRYDYKNKMNISRMYINITNNIDYKDKNMEEPIINLLKVERRQTMINLMKLLMLNSI